MLQANPTFRRKHIFVKIIGDGTSVSRTMHLVVIDFSLLDFMKIHRCHTIALLNTTEDYDNLYKALTDIADEMKNLHYIEVDGKVFNSTWEETGNFWHL